MTFLILIIIILGWIIFEQFNSKKYQDNENKRFEGYELKRKENFKQNSEFLENYNKIESLFKKLTILQIEKLKIIRTFEPDDKTTEITRNITLSYKSYEFYLTLIGNYYECRCYFLTSADYKIKFDLKFMNSENDKVTIENIINELERLNNYLERKKLVK
jgi:hypothetical protein